jgi:hypothetical protein
MDPAESPDTLRLARVTSQLNLPPAAASSIEASAYERVAAFWSRHLVLNVATLTAAACWAFYWGDSGGSFALLALLISVSLAPSWWIALTSTGPLPGFVSFADRWYAKLHGFVSNRQGNLVRLLLIPIVWTGSRWAKFADKREDPAVAASLRIFGYVLAVILLISLVVITAYLVVAIVIFLLMVVAALWIMGIMLGAVDGDGFRLNRIPLTGPRGSKIYRHGGSFLDPEEQVGRIGADGKIYQDDGSVLGVAERVGHIDDKGRIFKGGGGIFDPDTQIGKIDEQGRIFQDDGSILGSPERIGKIDESGRIQSGSGGLLDPDQQVGRIRPDK